MRENRLWHFLQGGVDIMDARTGRLRLRVMLLEKLSMLAANVDGSRGRLLAIDENGQRIFALTASGCRSACARSVRVRNSQPEPVRVRLAAQLS